MTRNTLGIKKQKHNEVGLRPEAISEKVKNKSLRSKESEWVSNFGCNKQDRPNLECNSIVKVKVRNGSSIAQCRHGDEEEGK